MAAGAVDVTFSDTFAKSPMNQSIDYKELGQNSLMAETDRNKMNGTQEKHLPSVQFGF